MKKRSLFAAVAMLLVSAIMLTSVTYAWFSANTQANVQKISASVSNDDGFLKLVATNLGAAVANAAPTTSLTPQHWVGLQDANDDGEGNITYTDKKLAPVSFDFTTTTPAIQKVLFNGIDFSGTSATENTDYLHYSFNVVYSTTSATAKAILLKPTVTITSEFGYILLRYKASNSNEWVNKIFSKTTGDSYKPVKAISSTVTDNTSSGTAAIIDAADTPAANYTLGNTVSSVAPNAAPDTNGYTIIPAGSGPGEGVPSVDLTANVEVYIWAEGNDSSCTGHVDASSVGIQFEVKPAA